MQSNMTRLSVSELFSTYEQEFKHHSEAIMFNLLKLTKRAHDEHDTSVKLVGEQVSEADQCLKHMEVEAASLPAHMKKDIMDSIRAYKKELQQVEKDLRKLEIEQDKDDLFGDRPTSSQINQALLKQEDRLSEQSLKLLAAKRTAYETEETAISIQRSLNEHTNTLSNSLRKTQMVRDDLGESNSLVNTMKMRIMQRRMVMYSVFGSLVFFGSFIVYSWLS